jgi:translation elongation factor EF-1beta
MSLGLLADVSHLWYDKYALQDVEQRYFNPAACNGVVGESGSGDADLRKTVATLQSRIEHLEKRVAQLEREKQGDRMSKSSKSEATSHGADSAKKGNQKDANANKPAKKADADASAKKDDDFELFGDEDEEESAEAKRIKEERIAAYEAKKSTKPALIAKSQIILDVKPWDDETDMAEMERHVRTIEMDGLLWGTSKLVPLAYGIKKLTICCVVEDDKVSVDDLEEKITAFENYVQSVDVAAFQKI